MKIDRRLYLAAGAFLGVAAATLPGCDGMQLNQQLVSASDQFANTTVGPEYLQYVEADDTLDEAQKDDRRINVQTFRAAIEAAKHEAGMD